LAGDGWQVRIAARHPEKAEAWNDISSVKADLHDYVAVASALNGASAAVNAVSLYVEGGRCGPTFQSVYVDSARRVRVFLGWVTGVLEKAVLKARRAS
jgi:uncharacterized protein YbjT (DUF2867 family)